MTSMLRLCLALLVLVLSFSYATGTYSKVCYSHRTYRPKGVCGKRLADLIAMICNTTTGRKRSPYDAVPRGTYLTAMPGSDEEWDRISFPKQDALSMLRTQPKKRGTVNIVCECCYHQCSYTEMETYCTN